MKRTLKVCLISGIILLLLAPDFVRAQDTTTKSPEDWLNDQEKGYVQAIQKADAAVRGLTFNIMLELYNPKDMSSGFYSTLRADWTSLNSALNGLAIAAPDDEFADIAADYSKLSQDKLPYPFILPGDVAFANPYFLVMIARMFDQGQTEIDELNGELDAQMGKVNAKVAEIAKKMELASKVIGNIFDSCSSAPAER